MIDKGVGGGIMVCIIDVLREVGENNCIMLKRIARGLGVYYPHSPPPSNMFHVEHFVITYI